MGRGSGVIAAFTEHGEVEMSPLPGAYRNPMQFQNSRGVKRTLQTLRYQSWVDAIVLDANGMLDITAGSAGGPNAGTLTPTLTGALVTAGVGINAHPRSIIMTVTHGSSIVATNGVVTGTDIADRTITAAWSVTATGTSKTSETLKAFKTVTSVTLIASGDASANGYALGTGDLLGLDAVLATGAVVPILELEDASAPTAGVLVAGVASHATADAFGTYDPNSALDGSADFQIWYPTDSPHLFGAAGPGVL